MDRGRRAQRETHRVSSHPSFSQVPPFREWVGLCLVNSSPKRTQTLTQGGTPDSLMAWLLVWVGLATSSVTQASRGLNREHSSQGSCELLGVLTV